MSLPTLYPYKSLFFHTYPYITSHIAFCSLNFSFHFFEYLMDSLQPWLVAFVTLFTPPSYASFSVSPSFIHSIEQITSTYFFYRSNSMRKNEWGGSQCCCQVYHCVNMELVHSSANWRKKAKYPLTQKDRRKRTKCTIVFSHPSTHSR